MMSPSPLARAFLFFGNLVRRVDLRLLAAALKKGAKQPAAPRRFCAPGFFCWRKGRERNAVRGESRDKEIRQEG